MATLSSRNPSFNESEDAEKSTARFRGSSFSPMPVLRDADPESQRASRTRTLATYAAVALVGAAALGVGVVLGNSLSSPATTATAPQEVSATVSEPGAVLSAFYRDQPELSEINFDDLDALVTQYENTHSPNLWANNFVPELFVAEWLELRREEFAGSARRLREQRELIGKYPVELSRVAHDSTFAPRVNPIVYLNDAAGVEMKGSRCVISFDTSQDLADWVDNLNSGNGPIYSINEYTESGPSCPTTTCTEKRILGQGYDGFRVAWNNLSVRVWASIQSTCGDSASEYVFTGYSRGGAIAAMASASIYVEGLLPARKIKQITFGAPLSIATAMSDSVHNKFDQYRFVYKGDPVPSIPSMSWGVRHFGEMRCIECSYPEGRDRPTYYNPFTVGDHGGYENGWYP
jgi:hypothetical protein